jgi:hypothetical protein
VIFSGAPTIVISHINDEISKTIPEQTQHPKPTEASQPVKQQCMQLSECTESGAHRCSRLQGELSTSSHEGITCKHSAAIRMRSRRLAQLKCAEHRAIGAHRRVSFSILHSAYHIPRAAISTPRSACKQRRIECIQASRHWRAIKSATPIFSTPSEALTEALVYAHTLPISAK